MNTLWVPREPPQTEVNEYEFTASVDDDTYTVYYQKGLLCGDSWSWTYSGDGVVFFHSLTPCCDVPLRVPRTRLRGRVSANRPPLSPRCSECKKEYSFKRELLQFSLWSDTPSAEAAATAGVPRPMKNALRIDLPLVVHDPQSVQHYLSEKLGYNSYEEIVYGPELLDRFLGEMVGLFLDPKGAWR